MEGEGREKVREGRTHNLMYFFLMYLNSFLFRLFSYIALDNHRWCAYARRTATPPPTATRSPPLYYYWKNCFFSREIMEDKMMMRYTPKLVICITKQKKKKKGPSFSVSL
jgi:hypothetical protein